MGEPVAATPRKDDRLGALRGTLSYAKLYVRRELPDAFRDTFGWLMGALMLFFIRRQRPGVGFVGILCVNVT
jgi:hypothetical protein